MITLPYEPHILAPDPNAIWLSLAFRASEEVFEDICTALDSMYPGWGIPVPLRTWDRGIQRLVIQLPSEIRWEGDEPRAFQSLEEEDILLYFTDLLQGEKEELMCAERPFMKLLLPAAVSGTVRDALQAVDGVVFTPLVQYGAQEEIRAWELIASRDTAGRAPCIAEIPYHGRSLGTVTQLLQQYIGWSQEKIDTSFFPSGCLLQIVFPSSDRVFLFAECADAADNTCVLLR